MPSIARRMLEAALVARNRVVGLDRYAPASTYFEPDGYDRARALCHEANRDLPAFIRPPDDVQPAGLVREAETVERGGVRIADWAFDSPLPSGDPINDRVRVRIFSAGPTERGDRVVLFHHPIYQRRWAIWRWFLEDLIREVPVAVMEGPHHFRRVAPGMFPGEGTMNPNPARLFEGIRQWCWDRQAAVGALALGPGLRPVAEVGFSLGAFQTLLRAVASGPDLPIVSISSTNHYAWGVTRGVLGHGLRRGFAEAGIDPERLARWTASVRLDRHVAPLRGHPVLYVYGRYDRIDPPPSLDDLKAALAPMRVLHLRAGHGNIIAYRRHIWLETMDFLREIGALSRDPTPPPLARSEA